MSARYRYVTPHLLLILVHVHAPIFRSFRIQCAATWLLHSTVVGVEISLQARKWELARFYEGNDGGRLLKSSLRHFRNV